VKIAGDVNGGTNAPTAGWWFQENFRHTNATNAWGTQVAWGWEDNKDALKTRNISAGSYGAWVTYLNSSNYNTYAPTLTGGGASGSWNITAATANALTTTNSYTVNAITFTGGSSAFVTADTAGNAVRILPSSTGTQGILQWTNYAINTQWTTLVGTNGLLTCTSAFTSSGNITAFSDERVKKNWRELPENFVDKLAEVKHGIYDRTDQEITQVGVSAQSLRPLLEHAIMEDEEGKLSVAYGNAALVACIKLAQRVLDSEKEIKELKDQMEILKGQIK
jgi:hypothetical protein